jgi:MoxR-like ATPase
MTENTIPVNVNVAVVDRGNELRAQCHGTLSEFNKYVIGLPQVGGFLLSSALQGGVCHFLAEGVPGIGKTRSVEVMARCIKGKSVVVQFTPDLMPKDITGTEYYNKQTGQWEIKWGPIVDANLIIGDEINRGDTRAQSALLSPMSEGRVTVPAANTSKEAAVRKLHPVNVFMCTQNPIEQEGTNPLPEAQHDRFLYKVVFDYPARSDEEFLMEHPELADQAILEEVEAKMSLDDVLETRAWIRSNMRVSKTFRQYALTVVRATRPGSPEFVDLWNKYPEIRPILDSISTGVSIRANIALLRACQVRAFLFGKNEDGQSPRDFVMPEDLKALSHSVLRHRIIMRDEAAHRVVRGNEEKRSSGSYPTDGTITRQQVVERLNRAGKNPITSDHVIDAILTHLDHTTDWSAYEG